MPPLVSILLPVRDGAATLPAALASLAAQTFRDCELIAVDDHSRDATPQLLAEAGSSIPYAYSHMAISVWDGGAGFRQQLRGGVARVVVDGDELAVAKGLGGQAGQGGRQGGGPVAHRQQDGN